MSVLAPESPTTFPALSLAYSGPLRAEIWRLDMEAKPPVRPTVRRIMEVVGESYNVEANEICSQSRIKEVLRARMVTMYLARRLTLKSSIQIARFIGDRDHTCVLNAVKKIKLRMASKPSLARRVALLEAQLTQ